MVTLKHEMNNKLGISDLALNFFLIYLYFYFICIEMPLFDFSITTLNNDELQCFNLRHLIER